MSDDIVARLRNLCITGDNMWEVDVCGAMSDAADEIERLRRELALALGRTCRCVNTEAINES